MTRPAAPDPVRSRLRNLGRDAAPSPAGDERVGWPTAPPGTPAARLRLGPAAPGPPARPVWPDGEPADDGLEEVVAPGPAGWAERARASAWEVADDRRDRWVQRWLPASWQGARWDPGRTGALALAVVTALAAVAAAVGVWRERPVAEPVPALPAVVGAPSGPSGIAGLPGLDARPAVPRGGPIVVSVTGRVARPGLVRLPEGGRVGDALAAAGGAARGVDLTGLNLAQRLADGEQVVVGVRVPGPAPGGGVMGAAVPGGGGGRPGSGQGAAVGGQVDLNAATLEQLDQLPGVGPVTAQKILDWRTENGRFAAIEQLQEVPGIGEARFAQLRSRVRV